MLRVAMHFKPNQHSSGFILFVVLIFLFVLTLLAVSGSQNIILEDKMQSNLKDRAHVFARSELGLQQAILSIIGTPMILPPSRIQLKVDAHSITTDKCGNQTVDIRSKAKDAMADIVLNARVIFAKEPKLKRCKKIPIQKTVWWNETS